jgi:hypothetical protein
MEGPRYFMAHHDFAYGKKNIILIVRTANGCCACNPISVIWCAVRTIKRIVILEC